MRMAKVEIKSIEDLIPDSNNINKHTQRGHTLVENSIRRRGVGRGILAAGKNTEKPVIMAGNLTHEKARDAGIKEGIERKNGGEGKRGGDGGRGRDKKIKVSEHR